MQLRRVGTGEIRGPAGEHIESTPATAGETLFDCLDLGVILPGKSGSARPACGSRIAQAARRATTCQGILDTLKCAQRQNAECQTLEEGPAGYRFSEIFGSHLSLVPANSTL